MNRRNTSLAIAGLLVLGPRAVSSQPRKPRIAAPFYADERQSAPTLQALKAGMRSQGFPDGSVEYHAAYGEGDVSRDEPMIAELIGRKPDVIVVAGPRFVRAALKASRTVPIVMALVSDPVGNKFVDSLARPGGNVTGITNLFEAVIAKTAEILHELVPAASRVAVLLDEANPSTVKFWATAEAALRSLGKTPVRLNASTEPEIVAAFGRMRSTNVQAALIAPEGSFGPRRDQIASLALAARLPTAYLLRQFVEAGGLFSYGPSLTASYQASARYVARILRGAKPADLAVEQASTFELVINRKTAQALGIGVPGGLLVRADEVIE